jgi:predicted transposase/invertase (TIGR01784 family)
MKAKYVNPFTDFGFKKIFGEEASKPLLIDFLNSLLPEADQIADLSFKNNEQLGSNEFDRKAVYDIYCENEKGEKFIVELQKSKQDYFIERTIYYSTFPIREQAERGIWNFQLKAVYCIGVLDFIFNDYQTESEKKEVVHTIKLKNQNCKTFYDKLTFIYLEMPNFNKSEQELTTRLDQWLFFIKHLEDFQSIPTIMADEVFYQAFETAEIAKFNEIEINGYERSLKVFRDNYNTHEYAIRIANEKGLEDGMKKGIKETKIEMVKSAKNLGMNVLDIIKLTGLSEEEIDKI